MTEPEHPRLVTISYFVKEMLGYADASTYYFHRNDKGWPQRVWPAGRPMLVYSECVAYLDQLMRDRKKPPKFKRKAVTTE